jgi:hypothetical protein
MILFITLGCLIALLGWLLITPLKLIIHSTTNEYQLRWGWLFKAMLILVNDELVVRIGVPFFHKDFFPLHPKPSRKSTQKTKSAKKRRKKSASKNSRKTFKLIRAVLRSFHIRQFRLNIDTDNYITNAYLYPLFYFLNMRNGSWQVNYDGRFEFDLEMDNRPIRLIRHVFFRG